MSNTSKPKLPIQVIFAMLLAVATLFAIVIAFLPKTLLPVPVPASPTLILAQTVTTLPNTATVSIPTDAPTFAATSTSAPTDTPAATSTPTTTPTAQPLPDLTVTGISSSTCTRDQRFTPEKLYVKLSFIVRNIGPGSARPFGPFSVRVNLILGQRHYSLAEWAAGFNGVIGSSNMDNVTLSLKGDVQLNVTVDLKGNTNFGVEVIANSGEKTIPETDTTNNTLIQSFSVTCS